MELLIEVFAHRTYSCCSFSLHLDIRHSDSNYLTSFCCIPYTYASYIHLKCIPTSSQVFAYSYGPRGFRIPCWSTYLTWISLCYSFFWKRKTIISRAACRGTHRKLCFQLVKSWAPAHQIGHTALPSLLRRWGDACWRHYARALPCMIRSGQSSTTNINSATPSTGETKRLIIPKEEL